MDDEPDDADQNEEGSQWNQKPGAAGHNGSGAVNDSSLRKICVSGHDGHIATDRSAFCQREVAADDRCVAIDSVACVDSKTAQDGDGVAGDIAANVNRAEDADQVACGIALGYGDVGANADAVVVAFRKGG